MTPSPADVVAKARAAFDTGRTREVVWRRENLAALKAMLVDNADAFLAAMADDLAKPATEAWLTDVGFVVGEVAWLRKNLSRLMKPQRVPTPPTSRPGRSEIRPEPLGVVAVIAPWNYPLQLALVPAAGAIAAGNAVVIKPSELAPATSQLLARLTPRYLDAETVAIVEGGVPETTALLAQRFDHIFYTGSTRVGRVVMTAAAHHLTPVTLELGGKSPAIVDASAKVAVAARRIAWGKFLNAGQTCVAPDYVLVHESVAQELIDQLRQSITAFYGKDPATSADYGRIVNDAHFDRLERLLSSGRAEIGGDCRAAERFIAPTVLVDVSPDAPVMQEEIFGPILPILKVENLAEAVAFVNARPKPLALYVFAEDDDVADAVLNETSAGGVTVNGSVLHVASPFLPFGGVGDSGMGAYHGRSTFDTFTHHKPVLRRSSRIDLPVAYPPFSKLKQRVLRRLL